MIKLSMTILVAATVLLGCAGEPTIQTGPDADIILGKLHKVDNARFGLVYVDPDARLSKYNKVMLDPLDLENTEILQPSGTHTSVLRNRDWVLTDDDKARIQKHYREVFTRELAETGDYEITGEAGPDVLRISAAITQIAPNAPKDDFDSRSIGRSRVYSEGAGSMAISFAFSDSETSDILGIVKDRREGSPNWGVNNSVTNMSDIRHIFSSWARMVRARLDIAHGY